MQARLFRCDCEGERLEVQGPSGSTTEGSECSTGSRNHRLRALRRSTRSLHHGRQVPCRSIPTGAQRHGLTFLHRPTADPRASLYRTYFGAPFPSDAWVANPVPPEKSVAYGTPAALAWGESFAGSADPSGRAVKGIHADAYVDTYVATVQFYSPAARKAPTRPARAAPPAARSPRFLVAHSWKL